MLSSMGSASTQHQEVPRSFQALAQPHSHDPGLFPPPTTHSDRSQNQRPTSAISSRSPVDASRELWGQPPPKKTGISMPSGLALADCLGNTYQGLQALSISAVSPATPCGHVFMGQSCIQPASHGKSCPHGCCHSWKHLCKRVLEAWIALASLAAHSQPGLEAPQTSGSTSETQCSQLHPTSNGQICLPGPSRIRQAVSSSLCLFPSSQKGKL